MKLTEIIQAAHILSQTAWDCAGAMIDLLSSELFCSLAVNFILLVIVLLGAVRLVAASE